MHLLGSQPVGMSTTEDDQDVVDVEGRSSNKQELLSTASSCSERAKTQRDRFRWPMVLVCVLLAWPDRAFSPSCHTTKKRLEAQLTSINQSAGDGSVVVAVVVARLKISRQDSLYDLVV